MRFFTFFKTMLLSVILMAGSGSVWGQTTIAAWTFPTTSGSAGTSFAAECGAMQANSDLYANGTNFSDSWTATGALVYFAGAAPSASLCSVTAATGALSLVQLASSNNNKSIVFKLSTTGYRNLMLSYAARGTATGFSTHVWSYSTDGTTFTTQSTITGRNSTTFSTQSVDFSLVTDLNNKPTIYIKLTVSGASGTNGNNRLDNFNFSAIPASSPSISTSAASLSGLSTNQGTASNSQTFTVGGSDLTDNLVVTAPTDFEVRENGTGSFSSSVSFSPSSGTVDTKTIEVRIAASAAVGTPTGNVVCSSTGATSQNIAVSGVVNPAILDQSITFNPLSSQTYGDAPFTISASGGASGNPVTFTSSDPTVATCSGTNGETVTLLKTGSCTINADQAGNDNYKAAPQVGQALTVTARTLTIPDAIAQNKTYDGKTAAVITGTLTGIMDSEEVTLNGTGAFADANAADGKTVTSTCTLGGANAANYTLTQPIGLTANITKADQIITLAPTTSKSIGDGTYIVSATGGVSGNPVTFTSSDPTVATCSGTNGETVTLLKTGSCTINADQAGNDNYKAAPQVGQALTVTARTLTIPDAIAQNKTYDGKTAAVITGTLTGIMDSEEVTLNGTGTFADANAADGKTVTSTCTLGGANAANYTLTQPIGLTANITKADQIITLAPTTSKSIGDAPFTISATGGVSGNPVTFTSSDPTIATCSGTNGETVTLLKTGSCTINADQTGNDNYKAALQVGQALTVTARTLTIPDAIAQNKTYDGKTAAVITGTLAGIINSEEVTLTGIGAFADANAADGKVVTSTCTLGGANAANYTLTQPTGLTANITKAGQIITLASTVSKSVGDADFSPATSTSSNTITYSSSNAAVASIDNVTGLVHIVAPGTTIITASQAGNNNYTEAADATQTVTVIRYLAVTKESGNWSSASTWVDNTVPPAGADVSVKNDLTIDQDATVSTLTVNPGVKLTNSGKNFTATTFNINSDATGIGTFVDNGTTTINGIANVQQYLGAAGDFSREYWDIASPVSNATSAVFNVAAGTNNLWYYNEFNNNNGPAFSKITTNEFSLNTGAGYVAYIGGTDATYTFSGNLNTGDITLSPTRTGTREAKRGFNLLGNPYPSYLDWNATTKNKVRSTIWYRTHKANGNTMQFDTFDGTVGTGNGDSGNVTQFISPMQAFWVKVNADDDIASLSLNNTMRSHRDVSINILPAKASPKIQVLRLKVSDGTNGDEALVVTNANATNGYDGYDSPKMTNGNTAIPEIYTLSGTEELVINNLNTISANDQLSLGFRTGQQNSFSIRATQISNFDPDIKIILKDNLLNIEQDITDGTAYNFTSEIVTASNRFSVIFKSRSITTGTESTNNDNNTLLVYKDANGKITVRCTEKLVGNATASVYNALGQKLDTQLLTSTITVLNPTYTSGLYLVSILANGKTTTRKVVIN